MENRDIGLTNVFAGDTPQADAAHQIPSAFGENDISVKDLIRKVKEWYKYLLSKKVIIIAACIIGGLIGLLYAYSEKTVYTAELTFVLEEEQAAAGGGAYANIAGQLGFDLGSGSAGGVFAGDNLLALMKSRSMIEKALLTVVNINGKKQTLADYYIEINGFREKWRKTSPELQNIHFLPGTDPERFSLNHNRLIQAFYGVLTDKNLTVDKKDKKANIISIRVNSESELFAKYFTEALAKEVSDFYIDTKTKKAAQNLKILQTQTDSVKRAFNMAVSGVASSSDANPNPNPSRQVLRVPAVRKQFDVQVNQAILTQLVQNLEVAKVSLRKETPLIQVIDKPVLPLPKTVPSILKGLIEGGILGLLLVVFLLTLNRILISLSE